MTAFLGKTTTPYVPHSSSEGTYARGCKNPFKNTRFCRNAVQHYGIVGVLCKSLILSRHRQPSNRWDLLPNLHLTTPRTAQQNKIWGANSGRGPRPLTPRGLDGFPSTGHSAWAARSVLPSESSDSEMLGGRGGC